MRSALILCLVVFHVLVDAWIVVEAWTRWSVEIAIVFVLAAIGTAWLGLRAWVSR